MDQVWLPGPSVEYGDISIYSDVVKYHNLRSSNPAILTPFEPFLSSTWRHRTLYLENEPPQDKTNNVAVRPAKTQISLGIRPVWSESSLSAWRKLGSLATHLVHSEDSDQTGWKLVCLALDFWHLQKKMPVINHHTNLF